MGKEKVLQQIKQMKDYDYKNREKIENSMRNMTKMYCVDSARRHGTNQYYGQCVEEITRVYQCDGNKWREIVFDSAMFESEIMVDGVAFNAITNIEIHDGVRNGDEIEVNVYKMGKLFHFWKREYIEMKLSLFNIFQLNTPKIFSDIFNFDVYMEYGELTEEQRNNLRLFS